jgi:hypothetical protein
MIQFARKTRGYRPHREHGVGGGATSNPPLPVALRRPGMDTRHPWMERVTPTHFILEGTTRKRKGEQGRSGGFCAEAHAWGKEEGGVSGGDARHEGGTGKTRGHRARVAVAAAHVVMLCGEGK